MIKNTKSKSLIIIPARLDSTRLPNKPLADINGVPMIIHVMHKAVKSGIGEVLVASGDEDIINIVKDYGGQAILTKNHYISGSDRIYEALQNWQKQTKKQYEYVINLQGDLPNIDPKYLIELNLLIQHYNCDIATLGSIIKNDQDEDNPNVVKIIASDLAPYKKIYKAIYFTRAKAPYNATCFYEHIGVYAYKIAALDKFIKLMPSKLELCEKLEQLRAIENNMSIIFQLIDETPIGVDTMEDLMKIKKAMQ